MTGERVPPSRPPTRGKSAPTPSSRLVPRLSSSRRRDGRRLRARVALDAASPVSRLPSLVSRLSSPVVVSRRPRARHRVRTSRRAKKRPRRRETDRVRIDPNAIERPERWARCGCDYGCVRHTCASRPGGYKNQTWRHRDESGPVIATPPPLVVVAVAPPSRRVVIGETMARSIDRSIDRSTDRRMDAGEVDSTDRASRMIAASTSAVFGVRVRAGATAVSGRRGRGAAMTTRAGVPIHIEYCEK